MEPDVRESLFKGATARAIEHPNIKGRIGVTVNLDGLLAEVNERSSIVWQDVASAVSSYDDVEAQQRDTVDLIANDADDEVARAVEKATRQQMRRRAIGVAIIALSTVSGLVWVLVGVLRHWLWGWAFVLLIPIGIGIGIVIEETNLELLRSRVRDEATEKLTASPTTAEHLAALTLDLKAATTSLEQQLDQALVDLMRLIITERSNRMYEVNLGASEAVGLEEMSNLSYEIDTAARAELQLRLTNWTSGSIGVAGPRGVGKSTLLKAAEDGRLVPDKNSMVGVIESAPVRYDTREFLLHLLRRLCETAIDESRRQSPPKPDDRAELLAGRVMLGAALVGIVSGVAVITAVATNAVTGVGAGLAVGGLLILASLYPTGRFGRPLNVFRLFPGYWEDRRRFRWLIYFGSLWSGLFGIGLVAAGISEETGRHFLVVGVVVGAALILSGSLLALWLTIWSPHSPSMSERHDFHPTSGYDGTEYNGTSLSTFGHDLRDQIDYQLSSTTTRGITASLALQGAPFSTDVTWSEASEREWRPMTMPLIVERFRHLVGRMVAQLDRVTKVVICIDELDKMEDAEQAAQFLNDVKAIFCEKSIFIVSVSQEALASFQRRGLPIRDAFDSAFDYIVEVRPLDWLSSKLLLARRLGDDCPVAFGALCFSLSGGLPRDLVRVTRRLFDLANQRPTTATLSDLGRRLVLLELRDKVSSTSTTLAGKNPTEDVEDALRVVGDLLSRTEDDVTVSHDLASWSSTLVENNSWRREPRGLQPANSRGADERVSERHGPSTLQMVRYLETYCLFSQTLLDIFTDSLDADDIRSFEDPKSPRNYDRIAFARRQFVFGPAAARAAILRVREAWGLPVQ
jgi:energy-coupling factor transporter ATP-binding protein EcfA2